MRISDVIDLEFRVTVLEKLLQRLLSNAVVSTGLTQGEVRVMWDQALAEIQARHPQSQLEMRPPPAALTEYLYDEVSRQTKYADVWTCAICRWQGISVTTARPSRPGESPVNAVLVCPACNARANVDSMRSRGMRCATT